MRPRRKPESIAKAARTLFLSRRIGLRCVFSVMHKGTFCAVVDTGHKDHMSVTNDAERVVEFLKQNGDLNVPGTRVIYRDSEGRWDEMLIADGKFSGFRHVGAKDPDEAVAILTRAAH